MDNESKINCFLEIYNKLNINKNYIICNAIRPGSTIIDFKIIIEDENNTDTLNSQITDYKQEIENLVAKCKAYKNKIKNQEDLQNANNEIAEQMKQNKTKLMDKLKNKQKSKYVKKTKEELQAEIEEEFKQYRKSYENDI